MLRRTRPPFRSVVIALGLVIAASGAARCSRPPETLDRVLADVDAGHLPPGGRVRLAGVVTGTSHGGDLVFVSDGPRGIALERASGLVVGRRVVVEAEPRRVDGRLRFTMLRLLESSPGTP